MAIDIFDVSGKDETSSPKQAIKTSNDIFDIGSSSPEKSEELPLYSRFSMGAQKAIETLGSTTGLKGLEEYGKAGQEYLQENKPSTPNDILSAAGREVSPYINEKAKDIFGRYADIPTAALKGATFNYTEAAPTPEDAGLGHKMAVTAAHLAGMGASLMMPGKAIGGVIPETLSTLGRVAKTVGEGAALGGLYGGLRKQEQGEDQFTSALNDAKVFGMFALAGGALTEGLGKLSPAVGQVLDKVRNGAALNDNEATIYHAMEYGKSMALGGGAGALEPAEDWKQRLTNIAMGAGSFGLSHGLTMAGMKTLDPLFADQRNEIIKRAYATINDINADPKAKADAIKRVTAPMAGNDDLIAQLNMPGAPGIRYETARRIGEYIGEASPVRGNQFAMWSKSLIDKGEPIPIGKEMFDAMDKWVADRRVKPLNIVDPSDTAIDPTKSKEDQTPSPTVTVYHGEGGDQASGAGGSWWTDNLERASSFGGNVSSVEIPREVFEAGQKEAAKQGSATKGDMVLPNEWVKKSKPTKAIDTSVQLDENVPSNADLEKMFQEGGETSGKETSTKGKYADASDANAAAAKPDVKGTDAERANVKSADTGLRGTESTGRKSTGKVEEGLLSEGTEEPYVKLHGEDEQFSAKGEKGQGKEALRETPKAEAKPAPPLQGPPTTVKMKSESGRYTFFSSKRQAVRFQKYMDDNPEAKVKDIAEEFFYNSRTGQGHEAAATAALKEMGYVSKGGKWERSEDYLRKREALAKSKTEHINKTTERYSASIVKPTEKPDVVAMRGNYGKAHMNNTEPGKPGWLGNPVTWQDMKGKVQEDAAKEARETGKKMWETNTFREWASTEFGRLLDEKAKSDPKFREELLKLQGKKIGYYKPEERNHAQEIVKWLDKNSEGKEVNVWYGSNQNAHLSNLADRPFTYDGKKYLSVEHAYQTLKSGKFDEDLYNQYKKAGVKIVGKKGTDTKTNMDLMKKLVLESFKQNPEAAKKLLETGDATLTHTQDLGVWKKEFPRILTEVRDELSSEKVKTFSKEPTVEEVAPPTEEERAMADVEMMERDTDKFFKEEFKLDAKSTLGELRAIPAKDRTPEQNNMIYFLLSRWNIHNEAKKYSRKGDTSDTYRDLIHAGIAAILEPDSIKEMQAAAKKAYKTKNADQFLADKAGTIAAGAIKEAFLKSRGRIQNLASYKDLAKFMDSSETLGLNSTVEEVANHSGLTVGRVREILNLNSEIGDIDTEVGNDSIWGKKTIKDIIPEDDKETFSNFVDRHDVTNMFKVMSTLSPAEQSLLIERFGIDPNREIYQGELSKEYPDTFVINEKFKDMKSYQDLAAMHIKEGDYTFDTPEKVEWAIKKALFKMGDINPVWRAIKANPSVVPLEKGKELPNYLKEKLKSTKTVVSTDEKGQNILREEEIAKRHQFGMPRTPVLGYLFDLQKMAAEMRKGSWMADDFPYYNQTLVNKWDPDFEKWDEAGTYPAAQISRVNAYKITLTDEERIAENQKELASRAKAESATPEEIKALYDKLDQEKELNEKQQATLIGELSETADALDSYTSAGFDFEVTKEDDYATVSVTYNGREIESYELPSGYDNTQYVDTMYEAISAAESFMSSSIAFGQGKAFVETPSKMSRNWTIYKVVMENGKPRKMFVSTNWDSLREARKSVGMASGNEITEKMRVAKGVDTTDSKSNTFLSTQEKSKTARYLFQKESVSKAVREITNRKDFQQRMQAYRDKKAKSAPEIAEKMNYIIGEMEKLAKDNKDISSRELAIALQSMVSSQGLTAYTEVTRNILNTLSTSLPEIRKESKNIMLSADLAADYDTANKIWREKFMKFNNRNADIPEFNKSENVFNMQNPLGYSYAYAKMSGLDAKAIVGLYIHAASGRTEMTSESVKEAMTFAQTYVERMDALTDFVGTKKAFADLFKIFNNSPFTKRLSKVISEVNKADIAKSVEDILSQGDKIPGLTTNRLDAEGFVGIANIIAKYAKEFTAEKVVEANMMPKEKESFKETLTMKDLKSMGEDFNPEQFFSTKEILNALLKGQDPKDHISPELSTAIDYWKENIIDKAISLKTPLEDVARNILLGDAIGVGAGGRIMQALAKMGYKDASFVAGMAKLELVQRLLDTKLDTTTVSPNEVFEKQINAETERIQRSLLKEAKAVKLNKEAVRKINRAASRAEILQNIADMNEIKRIVAQYYEPLEKEHVDPRMERLSKYSAAAQAIAEEGFIPKPVDVAFLQHIQSWIERNTGDAFTVRFGAMADETARINAMSQSEKEAFALDQGMDKNTKSFTIAGMTSDISIPGLVGMIRLNKALTEGEFKPKAAHELYHAIRRLMEFLSLGHKDAVIREHLSLALKNLDSMAPTEEEQARKLETWMADYVGKKNPIMSKEKKTFLNTLFSFFKHIGSFFSKKLTGLDVDQLLMLSRMKTFSEDQMFETMTDGKMGDLFKALRAKGLRINEADLKDIMAKGGEKAQFSVDQEREDFAKALREPVAGKVGSFNQEDVDYVDHEDRKIAFDKRSGMAVDPNDQPILDKIFGIDTASFSVAASMRYWGDSIRDKYLTAKEWFNATTPYAHEFTAADRTLYGYDEDIQVEVAQNRWRAQKIREMIKDLAGDKRMVGLKTKELEAMLTYHHEFTTTMAGYEDNFWRMYEADKRDYLSGNPDRMRDSSWLTRRRIAVLDRVLELRRKIATDGQLRAKVDRIMNEVTGIYNQGADVLGSNGLMHESRIEGYLARQVIMRERLESGEKLERKRILDMVGRSERLLDPASSRFGHFVQSTPHQSRRKYENIYRLWRDGMELESESIVENLASYMDRGTRAIAGKVFLDRTLGRQADGSIRVSTAAMATDDSPMDRMPLATIERSKVDSKGNPYKSIDHRALSVWMTRYESVGPIEDQMMIRLSDTSPNWRRVETSPGNWAIQENMPVYFHPEVYDRLKSYMSKNALAEVKPVVFMAKLAAEIKRTILSSSAFHYFAFLREYMLSNPAIGIGATSSQIRDFMQGINVRNPKQAQAQGYDIWDKAMRDLWDRSPMGGGVPTQTLNPAQARMVEIVKELMRGGATFGNIEDWSERRLGEKENIKINLDKIGAPTKMREFIRSAGEYNEHMLFQRVGVGLKVLSGIASYRLIELDAERRGVAMTPQQIASIAGEQMNAVYGGLNYGRYRLHKSPYVRAFFNPTVQFLMKTAFLAPDWTLSNLTAMKKIFTKNLPGAERALYNRWAMAAGIRLTSMLVATNLMVHAIGMMFGQDDGEKDLLGRLKKQWDSKDGIAAKTLNMLKVDVTPVAKTLPDSITGGNLQDVRKYYNVIGHFGDPFKAALEPYTFMKNKLGPIPRFFMDAFYGTNFKGETFTNIGELLGRDYEKGTYVNKAGMHKPGDPKWGKLKYKLTKFGPSAPVSIEQMPSFVMNEVKQAQPIWFQELLNMGMGYTHFFEFLPRVVGQQVMSDYVPDETTDPEKYVNMMKRRITADWVKAAHKAATTGDSMDPEIRVDLLDRLSRINTKAREHGMSTLKRESLNKREREITRYKTPDMEGYSGD